METLRHAKATEPVCDRRRPPSLLLVRPDAYSSIARLLLQLDDLIGQILRGGAARSSRHPCSSASSVASARASSSSRTFIKRRRGDRPSSSSAERSRTRRVARLARRSL